MEDQSRLLRLHADVVHKSFGGKTNPKKYWPLWGDKKGSSDVYTVDSEMFKKIKKAHGLK